MTCSTALIGDYFHGKTRERWLAMQTGTSPIVATVVIAVGGLLGEQGWRAPFAAYGFGFVLIPLVLFLTWEPRRGVAHVEADAAQPAAEPSHWRRLLWISAVTVFALTAFLVTIIQASFLLTERGLTSPGTIGLVTAGASLANPVGALLFGLTRWRTAAKLAFAFGMFALGFTVMSQAPTYQVVVAGAVAANLGAGFILPTLITWAIGGLPASRRGRGTGLWMSASFLGQFLSPLVVLYLRKATGGLDHAIMVYAVATGAAAAISLASLARRPASAQVGAVA